MESSRQYEAAPSARKLCEQAASIRPQVRANRRIPAPPASEGARQSPPGRCEGNHHDLAGRSTYAYRLKLSHAGPMMSTAKAELKASTGVGSSALLGSTCCDSLL